MGWFENLRAKTFFEPDSPSELQVQAWTHQHLQEKGSVTLKDIRDKGCNTPAKVVYRLRKKGVIAPISQDTWETGKTRYKRYYLNKGSIVDVKV